MFGDQKLFVKAEAFEIPVGTGLRTQQPGDDLVDPMLGSDVKELAGHDLHCAELPFLQDGAHAKKPPGIETQIRLSLEASQGGDDLTLR